MIFNSNINKGYLYTRGKAGVLLSKGRESVFSHKLTKIVGFFDLIKKLGLIRIPIEIPIQYTIVLYVIHT